MPSPIFHVLPPNAAFRHLPLLFGNLIPVFLTFFASFALSCGQSFRLISRPPSPATSGGNPQLATPAKLATSPSPLIGFLRSFILLLPEKNTIICP